jgi:hypothetical protein
VEVRGRSDVTAHLVIKCDRDGERRNQQ